MVIGLTNPSLPANGSITDPVNQYRDIGGILRYQSARSLEAIVVCVAVWIKDNITYYNK